MKQRKCAALILLIAVIFLLVTFAVGCRSDSSQRTITEDIIIPVGDGTYLKAQAVLPAEWQGKSLPLVSFSHGYGGTMNSAGGNYLAVSLAENGIATVRMDFAHYDTEDCSEPINQYTVDTMAEDQRRCIDYMADTYQIDTKRIGLYGRSLGGRVAMTLANEHLGRYDYQALALVAPAGNATAMQDYMGGADTWEQMKAEAAQRGSIRQKNMTLTPDFFTAVEDYVPSEHGEGFSQPVMVIYNTKDYVVTPKTSKECASAYEDVQLIEVTTEKSPHGYEMGFKNSTLKDQLIGQITNFFSENL